MSLTRLALGNPYLIVVGVVGVLLFGGLSASRLAVDIFPDLKQPTVVLIYSFRGMPARDMERNVVTRIERLLTQVSYLDRIESRSVTGLGIVKVFFKPQADPQAAAGQVANLAASIQRRTPPGMLPPVVMAIDPANVPVCQVVVRSDTKDDTALLDIARTVIRPRLGSVPGAAIGQAFGGKERRIMIYLDRDALQARGLSPMDVVNAIDVQNLAIPAGDANIGGKNFQIASNALVDSGPAFGDIPIKTHDGTIVFVRDVARAMDAAAIQTSIVRVDGRRQITIPVMRQVGANAIAVVDGVRKTLDQMPGLDDDVRLTMAFDQSTVIREAVSGLAFEGAFGGGLACLMVLIFLASWRSTLAVALAVPVSVAAAFLGLTFAGQTINTMTLGGLALSIGTLIDNSIVVLENITRHLHMGKSSRQAAFEGAAEVAAPVSVITLVNLAVYLPVLFLQGIGQFLFTPLAMTVAFAMLASLVACLTVVPAFCAAFLAPPNPHGPHTWSERLAQIPETALDRLSTAYTNVLAFWMARRLLFVGGCALLLVSSLLLFASLGKEFFPRVDSGQMTLHVRAPAATQLTHTEQIVAAIEDRIRATAGDDLHVMVSNLGLTGDSSAASNPNSGPDSAFIQVQLAPHSQRPIDEFVATLRGDLAHRFPGVELFFETGGIVSAVLNNGQRASLDIHVSGTRLPEIDALARRVREAVVDVPGVAAVLVVQNLEAPTLRVELDRHKAAASGLTTEDVMKNLVTAINSSINFARTTWIDPATGDGYYVAAQYAESAITDLNDIRQVPITATRRDGHPVVLDSLATLGRQADTTEIVHYGIQRIYNVHLEVRGRDVAAVANDVRRRLDDLTQTLDQRQRRQHAITLRGEAAAMDQSFGGLSFGLVLAVVTVYLVLVPQFRSFVDPLLVLFAVPMGLAGVIWTLYLTDTTLNIQSYIGTIMMIGICAANSIMLVDFANGRLATGEVSAIQAALDAARTRLRPILMTALAASLGLAPMAIGGKSHEANAPLARAVIGGLLCSTFFTLFLVPVLYSVLKSAPPASKPPNGADAPPPTPALAS